MKQHEGAMMEFGLEPMEAFRLFLVLGSQQSQKSDVK